MNYNEYWKAVRSGLNIGQYDLKSREIQKLLKYNSNPNAIIRHHLRDTEEQRKYNDEHYELWGFEIDENGDEHFEYGKYIIFVTNEEHLKIHHLSEETRKKISIATKARWNSTDYRLAWSIKFSGENNPNYGKHFSSERRRKISESNKARWDEERRKLYSIKFSGENNPNYGKPVSNETKLKLSEASEPTYGFGRGFVPTIQYYENGQVKDAAVTFNDSLIKNGGNYKVDSTYYTEERLANLNFLKDSNVETKVLKGLDVPNEDTDSKYHFWSHEAAFKYHSPILEQFLKTYCL